MNIFIKTLNYQIEQLKDNASILLGSCDSVLEFSNVALFDEKIIISRADKIQLTEINNKLQKLCNLLIDVKEEIYKL